MIIEHVEIISVETPYLAPFETSFGSLADKPALIVKLFSDGLVGYGECTALPAPVYNAETIYTCLYMIKNFIIPKIIKENIDGPQDLMERLAFIRGNRIAIAAVEMALWDLMAQVQNRQLKNLLGGTQQEIKAGVSLGIQDSVRTLLDKIDTHIKLGYHKIKIKIKPGWDVDVVKEVRRAFPTVPLMADANSAYTLADIDKFKAMDEYGLIMVEQPLGEDDIIDHATLQKAIKTPVCLDESINTCEDARKAIELGSCQIINIKPSRVGGLLESVKIHDLCQKNGIPVWCGGMLELGIGRVQNIALASLPNFIIPGDISASKRYFAEDITIPRVDVTEQCTIIVPDENNDVRYVADDAAIDRIAKDRIYL